MARKPARVHRTDTDHVVIDVGQGEQGRRLVPAVLVDFVLEVE
jgi:hypothetical protein